MIWDWQEEPQELHWEWQKECQAALRETNRLAAAQKILIRRLRELACADEEMPEVRALRKALDSLYGASRQAQFHPGDLADEEQHDAAGHRWMRVGGGVCAALMLAFATLWMFHKRTEMHELQKLRAVEAAQINSSPSRIAEPLYEPTEAASVDSNGGHSANPLSSESPRRAGGAATAQDRNKSTNKPDKASAEDPADAVFAGAADVTNPVQSPANDQSETAGAAGATSDGTTQTQPKTAPSIEPQEEIQNAASIVADSEERTPTAEPGANEKQTEERRQSTPAEPPASEQASENRPGVIGQGSVSVETGGYPSIRVPPELKQEAARSGASLQIGEAVSRVAPLYPEEAERQGIEGTVKLRAVIDKDGAVETLEIVNGPSLLATAAVNAIRQWRYRPTLLGDQPVEVAEEITVVFRIANASAPAN